MLAAVAVPLGILAYHNSAQLRRWAEVLAPTDPSTAIRPIAPAVPPAPEPARPRAWELARARLDRADAECRRALDEQLEGLEAFFEEAKQRSPRFADRVLGWEGRWKLVADRLRLDAGAHATFIRRLFREELFTPEELEGRTRQAVEGYLEAVRDIEGRMLVALSQDLAGSPTSLPIVAPDPGGLRDHFERAAAEAAGRAGAVLGEDATRELVALIVGEVLAQAAVRLGVSTGVLGAGAASAALTLGSGLVVGVLVDQVVSWARDGRGELIRELDRRIDALGALVVSGTSGAPGLRRRLERYDRDRAAGRRSAVREVIGTGGGGP
jgi:hypothetical protein